MLEEMPVLSPLSQSDWEKVKDLFVEKHFGKDDYIFFEGDPSSWLGVILEGRVKMIKHSGAGKDVVLDVISPGEMLGEVAAFNGKPYPATAQAMEPTVVASIYRDDFLRLLKQYPALALTVIEGLGRRLREAQETIKSMAVERVERRIARILLKLAAATGSSDEEGIVIEMPLTRQDIAEMVGTTVETAIRTMSKFRKKGLVQTKRGRVIILEPHQLVRIAEEF
ncbi:MAG: Crp/Fnr family transcriptional regulator [Anaerolineae bacterium]